MPDIETQPDVLTEYAQALDDLHGAIDKINEYVHVHGCDKSGFTGLFTVLHPAVDLVGSLYGETLKFGHSRLTSMAGGIHDAAKHYTGYETTVTKLLDDVLRKLDQPTAAVPEISG